MFKMVENNSKDIGEMKKTLEKVTKILESKLMNTQFVEEELTVDVMYVNEGAPKMMLLDSGAPKSVVSKEWIESYLKDMDVKEEEIKRKSCYRRFRMGETVYVSEVEMVFPIILKTDGEDYVKRELKAYVIDANGVNFLLGKETLKEWKVSIDYEKNKMEFKEKGKSVGLIELKGGHLLAQLELVGEWENEDTVNLVKKEDDFANVNVVRKIHRTLNHKSK